MLSREIPTWFMFRKSNDASKQIMKLFAKGNEGEPGVSVQKVIFFLMAQGVCIAFKGLDCFIYLLRFKGKWLSSGEESTK